MQNVCKIPWIKAERLHFNHILTVQFTIHCGAAEPKTFKNYSLFCVMFQNWTKVEIILIVGKYGCQKCITPIIFEWIKLH